MSSVAKWPLRRSDFRHQEEDFVRLTVRFDDALQYAARLHASQTRKGTDTPYIAHLLAVTAIVLEHDADEDEAIAALLHDAAEDQGGRTTLDVIRSRYGDQVARLVEECTDSFETPKRPWIERKKDYIDHLRWASPSVRLVAAADKLHNARSVLGDYRIVGDDLWRRFSEGKKQTLWFYREVTSALQEAARQEEERLNALIGELDEVVTTLEREVNASSADEGSPEAS
jgi:(p)ppGpp synthase/HD superfamily hydrolase